MTGININFHRLGNAGYVIEKWENVTGVPRANERVILGEAGAVFAVIEVCWSKPLFDDSQLVDVYVTGPVRPVHDTD